MDQIDTHGLEPEEYFQNVKSELKTAEKKSFNDQLSIIKKQIIMAKQLGQTTFLHRLVFTHTTILKEQQLLASGFDQYVLKDDVLKFITKVQPKNSVKIIELARYPRAIPEHAQLSLKKAQDLKLCDEFIVVFTDLSGSSFTTENEKKFVERNRDPIIFGMFSHAKSGLKHDRMYYIDSWKDEFCDLDFTTMVERMAKLGITDPSKKISTDHKYLTAITMDAVEEKKVEGIVAEVTKTLDDTKALVYSEAVKKESGYERFKKSLRKFFEG